MLRFRRAGRTVALTILSLAPTLFGRSSEAAEKARSENEVSCRDRVPFWGRVTDDVSERYCSLLERGRARLHSEPHEALGLARRAGKLQTPHVAAALLEAHAEVILGKVEEAHAHFSAAAPDLGAQGVTHLLSPPLVAAGARAALLSGDYDAALSRYRWVLLRLSELHDSREEARLLVEAAVAASYAKPDAGREARAYLAVAEAKNAPLVRPVVYAAWALSLLRDGDTERAKRKVAHFENAWILVWMFEGAQPIGRPGETLPVLPPGERDALFAAVAESVEPDLADDYWESFRQSAGPDLPKHLERPPK